MAQALTVGADDMPLRRKLFDKIDRARDLHGEMRAALKHAVTAVIAAYEQEKDDPDLSAPSLQSFRGLIRFLSQPYRADWEPPAIGINPEGFFLAIWDVGPNRYSIEFTDVDTAAWRAIFRELDGVKVKKGEYHDFDTFDEPPFFIPNRKVST